MRATLLSVVFAFSISLVKASDATSHLGSDVFAHIDRHFAEGLDSQTVQELVISTFSEAYDIEFLLTHVPEAIAQRNPHELTTTGNTQTQVTSQVLTDEEKRNIDDLMSILDKETTFETSVSDLVAKGRDLGVAKKLVNEYLDTEYNDDEDADDDEAEVHAVEHVPTTTQSATEDRSILYKKASSDRTKLIDAQDEAYETSLAQDMVKDYLINNQQPQPQSQPHSTSMTAKRAMVYPFTPMKLWSQFMDGLYLKDIPKKENRKQYEVKVTHNGQEKVFNFHEDTPFMHMYKMIYQTDLCKTPFTFVFLSEPDFKPPPNFTMSWLSGPDTRVAARITPIEQEYEVVGMIFSLYHSLSASFAGVSDEVRDVLKDYY